MQPRLDGQHRGPEALGHLLIGEALDVPEDHDRVVVRGERLDGLLQDPPALGGEELSSGRADQSATGRAKEPSGLKAGPASSMGRWGSFRLPRNFMSAALAVTRYSHVLKAARPSKSPIFRATARKASCVTSSASWGFRVMFIASR